MVHKISSYLFFFVFFFKREKDSVIVMSVESNGLIDVVFWLFRDKIIRLERFHRAFLSPKNVKTPRYTVLSFLHGETGGDIYVTLWTKFTILCSCLSCEDNIGLCL